MAKKPFEGMLFARWSEVEDALKEIGGIDRELQLIELNQNELIDSIKENAKTEALPLLTRKAELEKAMEMFAEANKGEFSKVRNKQFTFGEVWFRMTTKVSIKRGVDALSVLKSLKLFQCIRTKEEVDKEALRKLPSDTLAKVGANLKSEDVFGYQVNMEKIEDAA